ncbi:MAG: glyoxalase [Proteobacteria bacterium]|nr:glyoxalase [Pseudomonadota bacterium]
MSHRLRGIALLSRAPAALASFYVRGLGFAAAPDGLTLTLGGGQVRLLPAAASAAAYPIPRASNDPWFQHIAIVVTDMAAAHRRALAQGAVPISIDGPQRLPDSAGGVTAFKFRDPEGHPLELLEFPAATCPACWRGRGGGDPCIGIDHSAIVVADTARSLRFYAMFGFAPTGGSLNRGAEQAALDGLDDPLVAVTALGVPGSGPPHLELLDYRAPASAHAGAAWAAGDIAATRLLVEGAAPGLLRDPDGHFITPAIDPPQDVTPPGVP